MNSDYITDEQVVKRANAAVKLEIEKLKALDAPVIVYDRKKQVVVRHNNDGTEVEVGKRLRKGRYSERIAEEAESYFDECDDWKKEDIVLLTSDRNAMRKNLNHQ